MSIFLAPTEKLKKCLEIYNASKDFVAKKIEYMFNFFTLFQSKVLICMEIYIWIFLKELLPCF